MASLSRPAALATLACAVFVVMAFAPDPARAGFNQATCNAFAFDTAVPTELGALEFIKKSTSPPGGPNDMTLYNLNTNSSWTLTTNANIASLKPWFGFFVTETNFDFVQVVDQSTTRKYTGSLNTSTTTPVASITSWAVSNTRKATVSWVSDSSVANNAPPTFAQIQPLCKTTQTASVPAPLAISSNTRTDGLMLKTGDTIYYSVQQRANQGMVVVLDALATTASADFDLYVSSTNSAPDDSSFEFRGFSGSASEALLVPATGSSRTLFIGVHSFSGAGHFALNAAHTFAVGSSVCVSDATLSNRVTLTAAKLNSLREHLRAGSARFFAYTNGNLFRSSYNLNTTWTGSCSTANGCSVCIVDDMSGVSFGSFSSTQFCGHVEMHGANWTQGAAGAWLYAHESGHACLNLPDEYQQPPAGQSTPRFCGHTTMANNALAPGFCSMSHCRDGQASDNTMCNPSGQSNWQILKPIFGSFFGGPDFGTTTTAWSTPSWNNVNLQNLVTTNF